jgi:hypothetical protein
MLALGRRGGSSRSPAASPAQPVEVPSHLLRPRPEDVGAAWPAHACRCRRELPDELAWAAPLLDPGHPLAVRCARDQARRLIVWHHHLPTYEQVSFSCERLIHGTQPAERN